MINKAEPVSNQIQADILSFVNGTEHFDGLKAIRIVSKTYNLLIMTGYLSMIGEIDGRLELVYPDGNCVSYGDVGGFYKFSHDSFEFILKERK